MNPPPPNHPDSNSPWLYRYVDTDSRPSKFEESEDQKALRIYQRALLVAFVAPVVEFLRFLIFDRSIDDSHHREFVIVASLIAIAASYGFLQLHGFRILMLASLIFHFVFGGTTTRADWQRATCRSLWTLPYGIGLGVVIWFVYSFGHFGGWPDDVIVGSFANAIGAWMYLTIFRQWYLLRKTPTEPHPH
jgi:hypothetical protein